MIKKFCFWCPLLLLWLAFVSLPPALGSSGAFTRAHGHADTIGCWQVSCRLPVYDQQGQVDTFVTMSRRLYVDGQWRMYVFDGNECYLFHKDSLTGIHWDTWHPDLTLSFRVDSLRQRLTPYLTHFGLFKKGFGRLVSTAIDARTGSLKETYCDVNFNKLPNADSCYVTYTERFNFLPSEMSLSYSLDSLYGKRLYEVRLAIATPPAQSNPRMARRTEWMWKLEEIRNFDRTTIQSYFSR